jgi:hypothetical protein
MRRTFAIDVLHPARSQDCRLPCGLEVPNLLARFIAEEQHIGGLLDHVAAYWGESQNLRTATGKLTVVLG